MKRLFVVCFALCLWTHCFADSIKGKIGIGLGYPYLSLKYGLTQNLSLETRGAFGDGINVYGGRLYYNFNPNDMIVISIGGERDYVSFDTDGTSGKGYIGYGFISGEYFIFQEFTLNLDVGPAFISLNEDKFKLSVDGIEWIFNLGINFYFK